MSSCSPRQLILRPLFFESPLPQIHIQVALLKFRQYISALVSALVSCWTIIQYTTRFLFGLSKVINYPTIVLQLAGEKKVQEVLTGNPQTFLSDKKYGEHLFSVKMKTAS